MSRDRANDILDVSHSHSRSWYIEMSKNILTRFCFITGTAVLWAGGVFAAGPNPSVPAVKTVVRADARTGRLVRVVVSSTQPASAPISSMVARVAAEQSLPPALLHSVIQVESNYNPAAVSPKGAQGLMQLMPETARRFGVPDSFDPMQNIQGGAKYLKYLLELYKGDYPRVLAAYNAGEKAVARYGGIPPYAETINYVARVQRGIDAIKPAAAKLSPAPENKPASNPIQTAQDAPRHIQAIVAADGSLRYVTQ